MSRCVSLVNAWHINPLKQSRLGIKKVIRPEEVTLILAEAIPVRMNRTKRVSLFYNWLTVMRCDGLQYDVMCHFEIIGVLRITCC